jgi:sterol desaturase/sphingolipid hydroxylase (fatty acid hydroxylase superfamily)
MADDFLSNLTAYTPAIRVAALLGMLVIMAGLESLASRRPLNHGRRRRWGVNLAIVVLDAVMLRLALPTATVGLAIVAQENGWGLLNLVDLPGWAAIAISLLALDLALYVQHVLAHAIPAFWRVHRVHHTDLDMDVTTGVRFHPLEILISLLYKGAVVVALGASPLAVLIFEVLLNSSSLFIHANLRLPAGLERPLRLIWVTPDMHRVHHSALRPETDSNFGSCLALWDRLFRSYVAQPRAGHDRMTIGLERFRTPAEQTLWALLTQPFRREPPAIVATHASSATEAP